jgi:hypothetical protein
MLDSNPAAIVLLDEHKRVVYANRPAEVFRSGNDGARLSPTALVLARKQDNDKLQKLIARVLLLPATPGSSAGVVYGSRPSGKRPFSIAVTRVGSYRGALATFRKTVCIIIADPDSELYCNWTNLMDAFGLTQAEARLAALLATGKDLRFAAIVLGMQRLEEIFKALGKNPRGKKCAGMEGLIKEGQDYRRELRQDGADARVSRPKWRAVCRSGRTKSIVAEACFWRLHYTN